MTMAPSFTLIAAGMALVVRAGWAAAPGTVSPPPPARAQLVRDESLRVELLRMAQEDLTSGTCLPTDPGVPRLCRSTGEIRQDNRIALDRIIAAHGWPGRALVGIDGARAAWLIAQHADSDILFQKHCLELIREAFVIGEAEGEALAYLTDRVLEHEGRPQMYGTQGVGVTTPEDEARVDVNRKAIGLEPWRIYSERLKKAYASGRSRIAPWEGPW
jgi:hypothetical protein